MQSSAPNTSAPNMSAPNIYIGTPCFGASVSCNYSLSILDTFRLFDSVGVIAELHYIPNQIVTRARNILAHNFLKSNCTHLLFVDADIDFKPTDALRLINQNKSVICGLYANKQYINDDVNKFKNIQYSSTFLPKNTTFDKNTGIFEIEYGATGFMLIKRNVFEEIAKNIEKYTYNNETMFDFFQCRSIDGKYFTEDYFFCKKWKELNGKIYTDLKICLNHEGWHSYHGNPLNTFEISSISTANKNIIKNTTDTILENTTDTILENTTDTILENTTDTILENITETFIENITETFL
jgi:hypothetical protein